MVDIRILDNDSDLASALETFRTAMVGLPSGRPLEAGQVGKILEPGRTLGAFVDRQLVGTVDSATSRLTLPGGLDVPHAAVTHVGVLPTHTRQGIVSRLIEHQLNDSRARGEVVASLRASEATIYERFGYGVASRSISVELDTARAGLRRTVGDSGQVRFLEPTAAWDLLPRIYSDNKPTRPGTIERPSVWWAFRELHTSSDNGPKYVAVHGDIGSETGFVRYHPINTESWFSGDLRTVVVDDFFAPTDEAYLGLIQFLLSLDLVDRIRFPSLPVDTALPWLLTDHRAVRVLGSRDETWLRVIDVARALGGRSYSGAGSITLSVNDDLLPANTGTYRISAAGAEPYSGAAQLALDVATLAALLLGGTRWHQLAAAGRVRVSDPAALPVADQLFASNFAPFAGTSF